MELEIIRVRKLDPPHPLAIRQAMEVTTRPESATILQQCTDDNFGSNPTKGTDAAKAIKGIVRSFTTNINLSATTTEKPWSGEVPETPFAQLHHNKSKENIEELNHFVTAPVRMDFAITNESVFMRGFEEMSASPPDSEKQAILENRLDSLVQDWLASNQMRYEVEKDEATNEERAIIYQTNVNGDKLVSKDEEFMRADPVAVSQLFVDEEKGFASYAANNGFSQELRIYDANKEQELALQNESQNTGAGAGGR